MVIKKTYIPPSAVILFSLFMAFTSTDLVAEPGSKDAIDHHWLPNLTGMPDEEQVESLTQRFEEAMALEQDKRCTAIDYNLRTVVFQNFLIYQGLGNAQGFYFTEKTATRYAHILAMIVKESSGDSTNITDFTGRSVSTSEADTNLQRWDNLLKLSIQRKIQMNTQTNFGLTQLSVDRLFVAFKLAHGKHHGKDFLMGKEGDKSANAVTLNTAIAIRRLIWFYQDFAQGRLSQNDSRIHVEDIYKPEYNERYQTGLRRALLYCGTRYLFGAENQADWLNQYTNFEKAMASIAYCTLGNAEAGYGKTKVDEKCFAEWVTLCPALNVNIALLTPLSYFQTRGEKPVCLDTFKRLIIKNPEQ